MADTGFSRRNNSERDMQTVAIISVDPVTRTAIGVTRTRHSLNINCAYATGDTITVPAAGEQWYVERFEMEWRLYGRIPFNDPTLNIKPEIGQVSVGSARGPLELNGTEIRANGKVFRLNGVYYRDSGSTLERSADQITWTAVAGGVTGVVQIIANALAGFEGTEQPAAVQALKDWAAVIQEMLDSFWVMWNQACNNAFIDGLKRLGVGDGDVEKIISGFQNFVNYLFGVIFCDFTGDLTPQNLLARLRDLLAPIIDNPFIQGLSAIADALGLAVGNLLNDAVAGVTGLVELVFNIFTCNWDALALQIEPILEIIGLANGDNPFGPANIVKSLFTTFQFLGSPEIDGVPNPVGMFISALGAVFAAISETTGNLLQDAIGGAVEFIRLIFRVVTCSDPNVLSDLTAVVGGLLPGDIAGLPQDILTFLNDLFTSLLANPLVVSIQNLISMFFPELSGGSLIQQLIDGTANLVNWLLKIVTLILPFDELWRDTLLPFIDWSAVDAIVLPDLFGLFTNGEFDLWKIIFKPIDLIVEAILPGVGPNPFTNFLENLVNFFTGGGLLSAFFEDPLSFDLTTLVNGFLESVLQIITIDPITGLAQFVGDLIPAAGELVANLLAVFGIDFSEEGLDPFTALATVANTILGGLKDNLLAIFGIDFSDTNLDPVTALATVAGKVMEGVFGFGATIVNNIITNLTNLFGGQDAFEGGAFNIVTAATYFVNNVLNQAGSALQALVEGVGSLVYNIAKAIIEVIGKVPLIGAPIASTLTALLEGFVNFGRGSVASGSNLLVDPGAEIAAFWAPQSANATRDLNIKRSAGASLRVTSAGATARTVWFNVNDLGAVEPILSGTGEVNYAECYVLYPSTADGLTNAGTSGTVTLVAQYTNSLGEASPATSELTTTAVMSRNQSNWVKLASNFTTPTPSTGFYDRVSFGFRLAANATTSGAKFYVDDMLVREISAATSAAQDIAATNQNLYNSPARPASTAQIRDAAVPQLGPGKINSQFVGGQTLANDLTNINNTVSGPGGLTTVVPGLTTKTNDIVTNTFNAWYGSGSTSAASEMSTVVGAIKSTVSNVWTVSVLPFGTTSWTRPTATANILEFWVICVGGGSGGGKGLFGLNATISGGIGGSGGRWFVKQLTPSTIPASVSCSIGAGGAGATTHGSILSPNNGTNTSFGSAGQAHYVSTTEVVTSSIASILSFYSASDSQPGNGGNGGFANPGVGQLSSGYAGEPTPLAAGGGITSGQPIISFPGAAGNSGASANNSGQYRAGGGGGGGGGAGQFQNGGQGGNGGAPGGGGGGGGAANASGGPQGGNGGSGANGIIILLYRTA